MRNYCNIKEQCCHWRGKEGTWLWCWRQEGSSGWERLGLGKFFFYTFFTRLKFERSYTYLLYDIKLKMLWCMFNSSSISYARIFYKIWKEMNMSKIINIQVDYPGTQLSRGAFVRDAFVRNAFVQDAIVIEPNVVIYWKNILKNVFIAF